MVVTEFDSEVAEELVRNLRCQRALQLERRRIGLADGDIQTALCGHTLGPQQYVAITG